MNPFEKVKDSSIWYDADNMSAVHKKDPFIRIGIVIRGAVDENTSEPKYLVEVRDKNDKITLWCRAMSRLGGAYNYEEYTLRGFTDSPLSAISDFFAAKAGDFVLVAGLAGETREGIILGGLKHPSRKSTLNPENGPAYNKEFNGIEEKITTEGEYTVTFLGKPINESLLKAPVSAPIVPPIYNPAITGSYIKFDTNGSFEINDKAIGLEQSIKLDKPSGTLSIKSGMTEFTMEKLTQAATMKNYTLTIDSKISIKAKTLQFSVDAAASIKLKGLKVAIGTSGIELFDQLIQLIDALGKVQVTSPVGPCTLLMATPQWVQVELIKAKLNIVKGSL